MEGCGTRGRSSSRPLRHASDAFVSARWGTWRWPSSAARPRHRSCRRGAVPREHLGDEEARMGACSRCPPSAACARTRAGDIVVVDQFFDRTRGSRHSTSSARLRRARPLCRPGLPRALVLAPTPRGLGARTHRGGTYLCMEGPRSRPPAESRSTAVGADGRDDQPAEAKLAREAELCYSTLALATDYDCWHETERRVRRGRDQGA